MNADFSDRKQPKLIVVTGRPAAGKSTLAKWLAQELKLPMVSKDSIRELLFERLGWKDRPWAQLLGRASVDLMFHFAQTEFEAGHSIIMDNAFHPPVTTPRIQVLMEKFNVECIQIVCDLDSETLFKRFITRAKTGNRHPGHGDNDVLDDLYKHLAADYLRVLDIGGSVIEVDTTNFGKVDYRAILNQVKEFIESQ